MCCIQILKLIYLWTLFSSYCDKSQDYPLIKFNHSNRKEKNLQIICRQNSEEWKEIPYLERSEIMKLKKAIGRSRCVAVYCKKEYKGEMVATVIELDIYGNVSIQMETEKGYIRLTK